ncbi:hypothetical protein DBV05_g9604 [Lasiodiplodia theobromae]|uniref:BTB domain-containing protein n=1 Tax=Lasiodiplodia theobromae TaxID=45133 RepID=A0A5N5D239_9PEZI|nr:hypothetical protein DBV05_g9604 [Lasiodiplodia theobromae]
MATTIHPQVQQDQPQASPYASPLIHLTFGNSPQRWPIHSAFLSRHPKLYSLLQTQQPPPPPAPSNSSSSINNTHANDYDANNTLHLPHADPLTAHTLLHYLTTTRYQTLRTTDATTAYALALHVYAAAGWYDLRGLRDLAAGEIERLGGSSSSGSKSSSSSSSTAAVTGPEVPLEDALVELGKAVERACGRDQEWLLERVEERLRDEFKKDKGVLAEKKTWRGFNPFVRTLVMVVVGLQGGAGGKKGKKSDEDGEAEDAVEGEEEEEEAEEEEE